MKTIKAIYTKVKDKIQSMKKSLLSIKGPRLDWMRAAYWKAEKWSMNICRWFMGLPWKEIDRHTTSILRALRYISIIFWSGMCHFFRHFKAHDDVRIQIIAVFTELIYAGLIGYTVGEATSSHYYKGRYRFYQEYSKYLLDHLHKIFEAAQETHPEKEDENVNMKAE